MSSILDRAKKSTEAAKETAGFVNKPPRAGAALMRLRDYIEYGSFKVEKGQGAGKIVQKVRLVFELLHKDHMIERGDKGLVPDTFMLELNKSYSSMGKFMPLFKKMNYNGTANNMVDLIGQPFLGYLAHNPKDKDDASKGVWVNLDVDGVYQIGRPEIEIKDDFGVVTGTKDIEVPEMVGSPLVFCWEDNGWDDALIKEAWDSLFIDGEYEAKGDKPAKSKNYHQNRIKSNLDWEGSRTASIVECGTLEPPKQEATTPADDPAAALGL